MGVYIFVLYYSFPIRFYYNRLKIFSIYAENNYKNINLKGGFVMLRIAQTEKIKDVQTNYKSPRNVGNVTKSLSVKPTDKSTSDMANPTPAQQFGSEVFYNSLKNLKEAYKDFHHDEHELDENLKHLQENSDKLITEMKVLIHSYNKTVMSLQEFDKVFETQHIDKIKNILIPYQYYLKSMGITVLNNYELLFDTKEFLNAADTDKKVLGFLFDSKNGLFIKITNVFHRITLPRKSKPIKNFSRIDITGSIIDWKG